MYVKNKLFCNLYFKMGSLWMVRIWVYEAYLFSRYYFNIKGQKSCNSWQHSDMHTNNKVTALKTERPGLEIGKFHNILEWDPLWDRWAGHLAVFTQMHQHPKLQYKWMREISGWPQSIWNAVPILVILSTSHTFYTYIKERQMAEEEELGVCTAIKLQRSDLSLFSWVPWG